MIALAPMRCSRAKSRLRRRIFCRDSLKAVRLPALKCRMEFEGKAYRLPFLEEKSESRRNPCRYNPSGDFLSRLWFSAPDKLSRDFCIGICRAHKLIAKTQQ